jgi:hypothetical protein
MIVKKGPRHVLVALRKTAQLFSRSSTFNPARLIVCETQQGWVPFAKFEARKRKTGWRRRWKPSQIADQKAKQGQLKGVHDSNANKVGRLASFGTPAIRVSSVGCRTSGDAYRVSKLFSPA